MDQVMFVLGEEVTSFKLCKFKIGRLGTAAGLAASQQWFF